MNSKRLEILNKLEELHRVNATLEELGEKWGLDIPVLMNLNLCLEEALTNVIFYAFDEEGKYPVIITFERSNEDGISILLEDNGKPFNPLEEVKEPDVNADVDERKIGGLGVFFIRQFMDEVEYNRNGNTNQLRMLKRL